MARLNVSVLGELEVWMDGGKAQEFESDKVRALLAYLIVGADRPHRRETLIGLLWPDYPEEAARHSLRQALFNLRLGLGDHIAKPPYLLISRDSIQFNRESDHLLDLDQFKAAYQAWKTGGAKGRTLPTDLMRRLEQMVKLYRGEFLQHFSLSGSSEFENWIVVQRESLRQETMEVLSCLAAEYERLGDLQGARTCTSRQLELDPWREEAHYALMRLLALDGQRSAALEQYASCKKVLADELGVEPSEKTRTLYERIRSGALGNSDDARREMRTARLPAPTTPFIGRLKELADLGQMIEDPQCRFITLMGPGGIGKTRLALQAAHEHGGKFSQGAAFVPLASAASMDAVIPALANGVGYVLYGPAEPKEQVLHYLQDREMLLLLDNLEHLLGERSHGRAISDFLAQLLQEAPHVKLLITSREPLSLQGEWLYGVEGLAYPDRKTQTPATEDFDAITLFVQRARQISPGFSLEEQNRTGIAQVCTLVEGMPLAIELAATWVRALSPAEIAAEIERDLDFLKTQMRDLPERHRSIRAIFDRTWQSLPADERQVLGCLSTFRGGFQRQAAEEVAGASLSILSSLVTRSLVRRAPSGRYDLHELIRQYAASMLAQDAEAQRPAGDRHSQYYLGLLESRAGRLQSPRQLETLDELNAEMDNIRAAWNWAISRHQFAAANRVATTLWYVYELHNWWKEGLEQFGDSAEAIRVHARDDGMTDDLDRCAMNSMLSHSAFFKFRLGDSEQAYRTLTSTGPALRAGPDPSYAVYPLCYLGIVCWEQGRFAEANQSLQYSVELARLNKERWCEGSANEFLGIILHEQGQYMGARTHLMEALSIARGLGDPLLIAHVLSYLGRTTQMLGEYAEAEKQLRESIDVARGISYRSGIGLGLDALALLMHVQGKYGEARAHFQESVNLFREVGDRYREARVLNHQGTNFMALGLGSEAREAFRRALAICHERGYIPSTLDALMGLARLAARQNYNREALELAIYVQQHPVSTEETKDAAASLRRELESKFSGEEIEAAVPGASTRNLDEFVSKFLIPPFP